MPEEKELKEQQVSLSIEEQIPKDRHWDEFIEELDSLLNMYPHVKKEKIGFPDNWREILGK